METKELITAYAYSNLQRAILTTMLADFIRAKADKADPATTLQGYYGSVREYLETARFPPDDPNTENIRDEALKLSRRFFQDVEALLLEWGTISEKKLVLWGGPVEDAPRRPTT